MLPVRRLVVFLSSFVAPCSVLVSCFFFLTTVVSSPGTSDFTTFCLSFSNWTPTTRASSSLSRSSSPSPYILLFGSGNRRSSSSLGRIRATANAVLTTLETEEPRDFKVRGGSGSDKKHFCILFHWYKYTDLSYIYYLLLVFYLGQILHFRGLLLLLRRVMRNLLVKNDRYHCK